MKMKKGGGYNDARAEGFAAAEEITKLLMPLKTMFGIYPVMYGLTAVLGALLGRGKTGAVREEMWVNTIKLLRLSMNVSADDVNSGREPHNYE